MNIRVIAVAAAALCHLGCQPEKDETTRVALLMVTQAPDDAIPVGLVARLDELTERVDDLKLISGQSLTQRLNVDPSQAVAQCGRDLQCIGELGRQIGAQHVLLSRVVPQAAGARIQLLMIDAENGKLERRTQFEVSSPDDLAAALRRRFVDIFGVNLPPDVDRLDLQPLVEKPEVADAGLASCVTRAGRVQIRRSGTNEWEALPDDAVLSAGDTVRTADAATATLRYKSGAVLEISPGSELVVEEQGEAADGEEVVERVTVRSGVVRGTTGQGQRRIVIRASDGEDLDLVPVEDSGTLAYRVSARQDGALEVAVSEGRAVLKSAGGGTATIEAGRAQDVSGGALVGEVVPLPDFPKLKAPGVDATVTSRPDLVITFRWQADPAAAGFRIQVAEDQSFLRLLENQTVAANHWSYRRSSTGTFYWRVAGVTADGREGEFGFARRVAITPKQVQDLLLTPAEGATIDFRSEKYGFVTFAWRGMVTPGSYRLVVSRGPNLETDVVVSLVTRAQKIQTRDLYSLPDGIYYWGVFVDEESGPTPIFPRPRAFKIDRRPSGSQ